MQDKEILIIDDSEIQDIPAPIPEDELEEESEEKR